MVQQLLLFVAFDGFQSVTTFNVLSVLIISGLIGVLTLVFDLDNWSYLVELLLHFLGTFSLILVMMWLNHWLSLQKLVEFLHQLYRNLFNYLFIIKMKIASDVKRVNQKLSERHQKK